MNTSRSKAVKVAQWILIAVVVLFLVTRVIRYIVQ
jgi:hypothetical protein